MGADGNPAAPHGPLATSCRHWWQGWGVPAGEEPCSGSLHQPLSCSPTLQSWAWTRCVTFSICRRCSAPATREQEALWLLNLCPSRRLASSVCLGSTTTTAILAPSRRESHGTWSATPWIPTAASTRAGGGRGGQGELGFSQVLRASLSLHSPGY